MQYWQPMQASALCITTPVSGSLVYASTGQPIMQRLQAVVAAHRKVVALRIRIVAAFHFAHAPPVDRRRIAVLFVAGHHTALAADALRHIEVKAVLLARLESAFRNEWLSGR